MAFNWRPLMGRITAAFRQELGENLTGIYLHGSAAFGSMSEGSDLDFIAVTERPP
ncbi:MAG TPA: nucleotidyltransferase domain-containing protein, partial [Candidatus Negativibacillus faecipullorum]|nr:nucleotidyltransferase domain-containing protein [Candidatus Negativibacillus faecipullorum]